MTFATLTRRCYLPRLDRFIFEGNLESKASQESPQIVESTAANNNNPVLR